MLECCMGDAQMPTILIFQLVTDHKPLIPILKEHDLDKLYNPSDSSSKIEDATIRIHRSLNSWQTE